ncbi:phosphoribosylanthranilate isomerase [Roseomonas gilardii subsp. gilardii]|uniref:phosphoribosylanthranilate isomerase n=1 Tax=Roseomonas gilardii TaxID=257708 RepID=UPI001FFAB8A6|nr:phosphoribosylanthranilate isomerase [Roseomonas gilardii]UPG73105.1 phosphoribosylanthranilate isomerase [Roseomonas gilardii subsp. gilardii]
MASVKVCGINAPDAMEAVREARAEMLGFVFFPPSPRAISPERAAGLSALAPPAAEGGPRRVGLFVDPSEEEVAAVLAALPLDMLQLHGAETPERCAALRARFGLPVMKALGIASAEDFAALADYAPVVDRFLLDAKPPTGGDALPGGNAVSFDWRLLAGRNIPRPWLLAGGLTPANVAAAVRQAGAPGVDASSGLEHARGVKDPALIAAFVRAAHEADTAGGPV